MKRNAHRTLLFMLVFLCLLCWMEPTSGAQSGDKKAGALGAMDASTLFNDNCAKCHGKDGRAKTFRGKMVGARNLTNATWQASVTDEHIVETIKKGPRAMPSFEKKFSQEQIKSLVEYVRHFKREEAGPAKK